MRCPKRLRKNTKLLEAIGLLLAFTAWWLDWSAVQHWNSSISSLRSSIESIQFAYATSHNSCVVQLEAAVTRATNRELVDSNDPLANYAKAWSSAEVRCKWLDRISNNIILIENLSLILKSADTDLVHTFTLFKVREIEKGLTDLKSRIKASLTADSPTIPSPDKLRGRVAGTIDSDFRKLHAEMSSVLSETFSSLNQTKGSREWLYRLMFAVGAILFFVTKLIEWWGENTEP
jgi:hypothetical protein